MREPPPQSLHHHIPVLLDEVIRLLAPQQGESYLDLTAGYGGHARELIARTSSPEKATLVDRDPMAIEALASLKAEGARLIHTDFAQAAADLAEAGDRYDMVLVDLGVSSPQLDIPTRGFSFQPGPLDMRMDQVQRLSADTIINHYSERELIDILAR